MPGTIHIPVMWTTRSSLVGLADKRTARAGRLSGGQQRRLDVALALVGDPELVFLDEPTTGFDPAARRAAWSMIDNLRDLGKTVLLTTHYMEEAETLADRIAILVGGRIAAEGTPLTIGGRDTAPAKIRFVAPSEFDPSILSSGESVTTTPTWSSPRPSPRSPSGNSSTGPAPPVGS